MSIRTSNIPRTNRLRQPLMYAGSILLRVTVLLVVGLFPSISPVVAVPVVTESEAPFEQGESAEKFDVIVQTRPRGFRVHADQGSLVRVQHARKLSLTCSRVVRAGHRLSNNLLAPLRC